MTIFNSYRYVTDIMRNGLKENESNANGKLKLVARYLIENTTYKPSVIKKNLKRYAEKYFEGLSDDIVDNEIEWIFNEASKKKFIEESGGTDDPENEPEETKIDHTEARNYFDLKELTLYESEMKRIGRLDEELQELAFAFLILNKYQGDKYKWVYECNADAYEICHWNEKGKGKSQTTKNRLIHRLVEEKVIDFYFSTNKAYSYNKSWIAKTYFTVLINEDNLKGEHSPIWKKVTNYDDVMLYWRLYKGDPKVKLCEKCNAPIEDSGNSKRFCSDCALERTRQSKKRSKENALKSAS